CYFIIQPIPLFDKSQIPHPALKTTHLEISPKQISFFVEKHPSIRLYYKIPYLIPIVITGEQTPT
ncbi:MAG: hypothetical protein K1W28_02450, partial [Lachnospiraceae bacterium]